MSTQKRKKLLHAPPVCSFGLPFCSFVLYASWFIACMFPLMDLHAGIEKRILDDGSVEYYNGSTNRIRTDYPKSRAFQVRYSRIINRTSHLHGLDPYLVACIIKVESDFDHKAVSPAGARGLMQLMPDTARMYHITDIFDPGQNIHAGVRHFSYLMKRCGNDIPLALAAYHAGLSRVRLRMSVPEINSTIQYVNRVMYLYTGEKDAAYGNRPLRSVISSDGILEITNE